MVKIRWIMGQLIIFTKNALYKSESFLAFSARQQVEGTGSSYPVDPCGQLKLTFKGMNSPVYRYKNFLGYIFCILFFLNFTNYGIKDLIVEIINKLLESFLI